MTYTTILKIAIAFAIAFVTLISCSTPKATWGKGDGMNRQCTHLTSNRLPFNFN